MLRRTTGSLIASLAVLAIATPALPASAATTVAVTTTVTTTVLPGLSGDTVPGVISDSGLVVGRSEVSAGVTHAVTWSGGVLRDINPSGAATSSAVDVNATGQTLVNSAPSTTGIKGDTWIWKNGAFTKTEPLNALYTYGTAINNSGQVTLAHTALSYQGARGPLSLGRWSGGFVIDYATPNGFTCCSAENNGDINSSGQTVWTSNFIPIGGIEPGANFWNGLWNTTIPNNSAFNRAVGINDSGQVAIYGDRTAYLWKSGTLSQIKGIGGSTYANWIPVSGHVLNNSGQVVGYSETPDGTTTHATVWKNGVLTDLGSLPGGNYSLGAAINDAGQVVGVAANSSAVVGFLWQNGVMTALPTPAGGTGVSVIDINNHGQVIGSYYGSDGKLHGVEWTVTTA